MHNTGTTGPGPAAGAVLNTGGQPPSPLLLAWAHRQGRPVEWLGHPDWHDQPQPAGRR